MRKTLTIAIPVYERGEFFREALESALHQTLPVNILVLDNASQAFDFKQVIEEYKSPTIAYHRNPVNLGAHGNLNRCIELCPTPYVLILHDDDVLERDYVEFFSRNFEPAVDFYWGKASIIDREGRVLRREAVDYERFQKIEPWCTHNGSYQGAIMRREKALELGMFDPTARYFPDWDLNMKFMVSSETRFLPSFAVRYRICEMSATARQSKDYRFHAYGRLQIKRNFHRAGLWQRYRAVRFTRLLPVPSLTLVFAFLPQLSPLKLRYFCALITRSEAACGRNRITKIVVRLIGCRGVRLFGNLWRRLKPSP